MQRRPCAGGAASSALRGGGAGVKLGDGRSMQGFDSRQIALPPTPSTSLQPIQHQTANMVAPQLSLTRPAPGVAAPRPAAFARRQRLHRAAPLVVRAVGVSPPRLG